MPTRQTYQRLKAEHRCPNCGQHHDSSTLNCERCLAKRKEKYGHQRPNDVICPCGTIIPVKKMGGIPKFCKNCKRLRNNAASLQKYRRQGPIYSREYARQWRKTHPMRSKDNELRHAYGITLEDAHNLYLGQNGTCAICGLALDPIHERQAKHTPSRPYIDHDHKTGKVRGILCRRCNWALGFLDDNPIKAQRVIDYLIATSSSR